MMIENISSLDDCSGCRLSICIATRNRCALLTETLSSILAQIDDRVEIVVVDGASSDETQQAMENLVSKYPQVRYFREEENGGIDRDYDKAVGFAVGTYCWLMSDDDLFLPGAIERVMAATEHTPSLIVVDAEVRDEHQSEVLLERRMELTEDRYYGTVELEALFRATARQLTFIGSAIVRRSMWLARQREPYFGSYFIHVGVIFQQPLPDGAMVLVHPCLSIRYGNASWTARAFEIWMLRWPELVWSLASLSDEGKRRVVSEKPYESVRELILLRSKGAYSWNEYRRWLAAGPSSRMRKLLCACISLIPGGAVNIFVIAYVLAFSRATRFALVDLVASPYFPFKFIRRNRFRPQPKIRNL